MCALCVFFVIFFQTNRERDGKNRENKKEYFWYLILQIGFLYRDPIELDWWCTEWIYTLYMRKIYAEKHWFDFYRIIFNYIRIYWPLNVINVSNLRSYVHSTARHIFRVVYSIFDLRNLTISQSVQGMREIKKITIWCWFNKAAQNIFCVVFCSLWGFVLFMFTLQNEWRRRRCKISGNKR